MKHTKKLLATALLVTMLAGCKSEDAKALPKDYDKTLGDINMETVYDATITAKGYSAMFDELLKQIIKAEGIEANRSEELYERINDEIVTLIQNDSSFIEYGDYSKNNPITQKYADGEDREYGVFDDNLAATKLRADGYTLTCNGSNDVSTCDIWDAKAALTDDTVVNTYIEELVRPRVLRTMLDEEYIVQKKQSYFSTTQFRRIETVFIDFDAKYEQESTSRLYDFQSRLLAGNMTLENVEDEWQAFKVANVNKEIAEAEANTDKKEEMLKKYVCNDVWEVCKNKALKSADEAEYYEEAEIYTNSSTIVNSNISSRIFSSTIISNETNRNLYLIKDPTSTEDNEWYFMKQYVNEPLPVDSIINREGGKSYFIRVQFIKDAGKLLDSGASAEDIALRYEIAKVLAEKSSNLSGNILYFLNKYNVTIHDQEFLDYVKSQYDYPEDDED